MTPLIEMTRRFSPRIVFASAVVGAALTLAVPLFAVPGTHVGSVTFSIDCPSGLGVGIAYDGTNLWYSCYDPTGMGGPDLHRASPTTGVVSASFDIVATGGLGALSYDATRNVIWAGEGGGGPAGEPIYKISLDAGKMVTGTTIEADVSDPGFCDVGLDDGLAFDANGVGPADDVIYYSNDCGTTVIRAYSIAAFPAAVFSEPPFLWGGAACYNSGLAIGGALLFEGSDGCTHVWVEDKTTKMPAYDFSTIVAGDPSFRDEDLECDTDTFAPIDVMWSKEAFSPMRAHAFEIEKGTCGVGGEPPEPELPGRMTGGGRVTTASRVTHGFELHCTASDLPNNLQVNWGGNRFHLESLTSASCTDTPLDQKPPSAPFDTYKGKGTGRYNGTPGATAEWTFTDAGEPGKSDTMTIEIKDSSSAVVLSVTGTLDQGNHQAHEDK